MYEIAGIGVDLCEIDRMVPLLEDDLFLSRCFTDPERAYVAERGRMAASSLAAMWAAKEAALKAFGVGLSLPMKEIEICHNEKGQPSYQLQGKALDMLSGGRLHLSLSHEGNMAVAFCVWEKENTIPC